MIEIKDDLNVFDTLVCNVYYLKVIWLGHSLKIFQVAYDEFKKETKEFFAFQDSKIYQYGVLV